MAICHFEHSEKSFPIHPEMARAALLPHAQFLHHPVERTEVGDLAERLRRAQERDVTPRTLDAVAVTDVRPQQPDE